MAPEQQEQKYKPHFNFITLHYSYLIGLIIVCSVIIYPVKNMSYIDALFFASGACTQSGLNPIDMNLIKSYQQIFLFLFPMVTNPIFIHTCVVYIRLHWFEKRFQHIVKMSRLPSKARSMTQDRMRENPNVMERGIRGIDIRVLHPDIQSSRKPEFVDGPLDVMMELPSEIQPEEAKDGENEERRILSPKASSSTMAEPQTAEGVSESVPGTGSTDIQFNDSQSLPDDLRRSITNNTHIAFAESQRSSQHGKALRIPGPREFEKGDRAKEVDDDGTYTLSQTRTGDDAISVLGSQPSRSYSIGKAGTNASNSARFPRLPTVDQFLPQATTVMSSAFSMGTARRRRLSNLYCRKPEPEIQHMPYLSYTPTVGRNSQFVDLTDEQRDELGGIEYRSLKLLGRILLGYFIFFHTFGLVSLLPWIYHAPYYKDYILSLGINPTWWAFFTSQTAFNDVGFTLTPDSMVSFQKATWILLVMTFLVIIGNTGFPCLLRFIIWLFFKIAPNDSSIKESLNFLLDHPRRCFTLLFPSRETWVLFGVLIGLNVGDVILFIVLDLHDADVQHIATGHRIVAAIFQAASTRTAGLSVVSIAELHPAVQVSYMIMMYISVFPVAISVRRTNVYEEKSLGVYSNDDFEAGEHTTSSSYVGFHLRKQLSFDLWYIFLGLFIISICEGNHLQNTNDYAFTIFSVLFEIVSAYGTVGLSMGYPNTNSSFSAQFTTVSKLVIIAMQIRGRHRGLPYELDRAVLLPKEQRDADLSSIHRRGSRASSHHSPSFSPSLTQLDPLQTIHERTE